MQPGNSSIYIPEERGKYFPSKIFEDNYIRWSPNGNWSFVPKIGYKFHITCQENDAARVADMVTLGLRTTKVCHKLLPDLSEFRMNSNGNQKGKFIVAYLTSPNVQVISMIDQFMRTENIARGPAPRIRNKDNSVGAPEENVGLNIYRRRYDLAHP